MTNKLLLIIFILCALFLSALVARNGQLLLLGMPFLIYLILGVIRAPQGMTLAGQRFIDKTDVLAGEPFESQTILWNHGEAVVNLRLDDGLSASMTLLEGKARSWISLPAGASTELKYSSSARRGVYHWESVQATASDPFGLFEIEQSVPAYGEILVRPAPLPLRRIPLKPRFTLQAAGPLPARLAGSGTDFWGIREYRPGDSLRRLNWRSTARHPRSLFTNEFEREQIGDFGLILDARCRTDDLKMEADLFEHSVSAVAALSEYFLKKGNRVALLIFGDGYTSLFPGYGKRQRNLVLRNLARARLGEDLPMHYLQYFPVRLFPAHSQIVMVSPVDARDLETYARLRASGYDVLLISPDPVVYSERILPKTELNALAARAARIERAITLRQLSKLGVEVIDWQVSASLDAAIQNSAGRMTHRRNIRA